MSWITITQGRLWQQLCDSLKGWKESLCAGEKQQELPRSYQGSKQSQEVTPIWKTEERKKSVSMVYPVPLSSKTLATVGSEAGWGSIHFDFFGTLQWRISSVRTLLGIWTIIFRLEIFLGFWKELALTWSSVHNGLRLVWLVWPPAHLLPRICQISSCKRPDYFWLVKTSVNSTASYIFFYFNKIHKKFVWKQTRWSLFPKQSICLQRCNPSFAAFAFVNGATTAGFVLIKANIATLIAAWDLWSFRLGSSRCKVLMIAMALTSYDWLKRLRASMCWGIHGDNEWMDGWMDKWKKDINFVANAVEVLW